MHHFLLELRSHLPGCSNLCLFFWSQVLHRLALPFCGLWKLNSCVYITLFNNKSSVLSLWVDCPAWSHHGCRNSSRKIHGNIRDVRCLIPIFEEVTDIEISEVDRLCELRRLEEARPQFSGVCSKFNNNSKSCTNTESNPLSSVHFLHNWSFNLLFLFIEIHLLGTSQVNKNKR